MTTDQKTIDNIPHQSRQEIINYIALHLNCHPLVISTVCYLADKLHLSRHGHLMSGCMYVKKDYGIVPFEIFNIVFVEGIPDSLSSIEIDLTATYPWVTELPDLDYISDVACNCMDVIIQNLLGKRLYDLFDLTKDAAWASVPMGETIPILAIARTLDNAQEIVDYLLD